MYNKYEHFNELSENTRNTAVQLMLELFKEHPDVGNKYVEAITEHGDKWPSEGGYHFYGGMGIRNYFRQNGLAEKNIEIDNWDDYYIPCIEKAVQEKYNLELGY